MSCHPWASRENWARDLEADNWADYQRGVLWPPESREWKRSQGFLTSGLPKAEQVNQHHLGENEGWFQGPQPLWGSEKTRPRNQGLSRTGQGNFLRVLASGPIEILGLFLPQVPLFRSYSLASSSIFFPSSQVCNLLEVFFFLSPNFI